MAFITPRTRQPRNRPPGPRCKSHLPKAELSFSANRFGDALEPFPLWFAAAPATRGIRLARSGVGRASQDKPIILVGPAELPLVECDEVVRPQRRHIEIRYACA